MPRLVQYWDELLQGIRRVYYDGATLAYKPTIEFTGDGVSVAIVGERIVVTMTGELVGGVPEERTVSAGAGMTGGGDLSSNITLNVIAHADGSITVNPDSIQVGVLASDAQHGNRGGGSVHALAVAGGAAGFISGTEKTNLTTLTAGTASNADALHDHQKIVVNGLTTTGLANGDFGYVSGANTVSKTDSAALATSRCIGANEGVASRMTVGGIITAAKFTTAGGSPSNGAAVYLAAAADDTSTGAGKLTATEPVAGVSAEVGICIDNSLWASAKTCKIVYQPKAPIVI